MCVCLSLSEKTKTKKKKRENNLNKWIGQLESRRKWIDIFEKEKVIERPSSGVRSEKDEGRKEIGRRCDSCQQISCLSDFHASISLFRWFVRSSSTWFSFYLYLTRQWSDGLFFRWSTIRVTEYSRSAFANISESLHKSLCLCLFISPLRTIYYFVSRVHLCVKGWVAICLSLHSALSLVLYLSLSQLVGRMLHFQLLHLALFLFSMCPNTNTSHVLSLLLRLTGVSCMNERTVFRNKLSTIQKETYLLKECHFILHISYSLFTFHFSPFSFNHS